MDCSLGRGNLQRNDTCGSLVWGQAKQVKVAGEGGMEPSVV